jgi:glyoxylate/hydroxypyruvate reductase A
MAILVAADFNSDEWATWWPLLQAALPDEQLVRDRQGVAAGEVDVAIVANPPPGSLRDLTRLRLIQSLWAGVDRLLADETVPPQIPLARMVDPAMNDTMAQTALWAVLSLHRNFFDYASQQRASVWRQRALRRADEVTVGVLGLGQMGRNAAALLSRHGYRVLGWSRSASAIEGVETHAGDKALPRVLSQSQVVINLLPLTPGLRGFFNAERLAQMPRGASFVNLARGAHVVDTDVLAALESGHLHRAVLDVFASEPLPADHAFWSHPSVTVLPHVAAQTDARSAAAIAARNVQALRRGEPLANLVDRALGY